MSHADDLRDEAAFWAHFNLDALEHGTPHWLDLRQATKVARRPYNCFDDPRIERALRGRLKERFLAAAGEGPGRALDFGCGMGWLALELARQGWQVEAMDLAPASIEVAADWARRQGLGEAISHRVADLGTEPLGESVYDLVVVWDVLHHLPDPEEALARIKASLRPGGQVLILDHLGFDSANAGVVRWLHRLLPMAPGALWARLRRRLGLGQAQAPPAPVRDSPFEHCSEERILPAVANLLPGATVEEHLPIGIHLAHHHEAPGCLAGPVWRFVAWLDRLLLARGARGEYVMVRWRLPKP